MGCCLKTPEAVKQLVFDIYDKDSEYTYKQNTQISHILEFQSNNSSFVVLEVLKDKSSNSEITSGMFSFC